MSSILYFFYAFLFTALFIWGQRLLSKLQNLPPGPIRWPILGSIPQMMMIDLGYPYRQMVGLANKYGPVMSIGYGVHYAVVVSAFDIMKELFKQNETNMHRFRFQFVDQRTNGQNQGIIWGGGEPWKEIRRYTMKGLKDFGFGKIRSMEDTYKEEIDLLLEDIREETANTDGIWEVQPHRFSVVTINVVWSSVGGYRFDHYSDTIKEHIKLNIEVFEMLRATNPLSAFPFLKIFPKLSGYSHQEKMHKRCHNFMKELMEDVKTKRKGRLAPESFVELFLDEIEKNKGNSKSEMTEGQLIAILMDLFLAGTDTTTTVLNWFILYMALNSKVQTKLRQEIQQASKDWTKRIPIAEGSRLPYTRACFYETMRHSPFASLPPPRQASTDIVCAGYNIPKGTCMFYNLHPVFHDQEFWGADVEEFNPERFFLPNTNTLDSHKLHRVPQFGFGARICPGESLAMDILTAVALGLLSNFKIGLVEGREATLEESIPSLTINPKPYFVKLEQIRH